MSLRLRLPPCPPKGLLTRHGKPISKIHSSVVPFWWRSYRLNVKSTTAISSPHTTAGLRSSQKPQDIGHARLSTMWGPAHFGERKHVVQQVQGRESEEPQRSVGRSFGRRRRRWRVSWQRSKVSRKIRPIRR